jgi:hypothetical protein
MDDEDILFPLFFWGNRKAERKEIGQRRPHKTPHK